MVDKSDRRQRRKKNEERDEKKETEEEESGSLLRRLNPAVGLRCPERYHFDGSRVPGLVRGRVGAVSISLLFWKSPMILNRSCIF